MVGAGERVLGRFHRSWAWVGVSRERLIRTRTGSRALGGRRGETTSMRPAAAEIVPTVLGGWSLTDPMAVTLLPHRQRRQARLLARLGRRAGSSTSSPSSTANASTTRHGSARRPSGFERLWSYLCVVEVVCVLCGRPYRLPVVSRGRGSGGGGLGWSVCCLCGCDRLGDGILDVSLGFLGWRCVFVVRVLGVLDGGWPSL